MAKGAAIVEGMEFVQHQLTQLLPRETAAVLRRSTAKIAATIRKDMKKNAPRVSGTLRKAIVSRSRRGKPDLIAAGVFITKGKAAKHDAYYWHMVAYGTQHSAAQDFVTGPVERARVSYKRDLSREVASQVLKQLAKRAKRQKIRKLKRAA